MWKFVHYELAYEISNFILFQQSQDEEREILELKLNWEQQKYQFHQRLESLESQLKEAKNSSIQKEKELEQVSIYILTEITKQEICFFNMCINL